MGKHFSLISTAQTLWQSGLFAFTSRTLADLLNIDAVQAAHLLARMEAQGLVVKLERGKYLLLGLSPERTLSNPLFIGSQVLSPAYISFWSALHFYGFTEQVPQTVFVATTRRKSNLAFQGVNLFFVTIPSYQMFGYQREMHGDLPIVIADKAKAILDSLQRPQYAGGLSEVAKSLSNALADLDLLTLITYANQMRNLSLGSRLGYLLGVLGVTVEGLEVSRGPVNLDPEKPRHGVFDSRWRVYANLPLQSLFPQGIG